MPTLADSPVLLRRCNGCGMALREATAAEITAQRDGQALPDVRRDCRSCAPNVTRQDLAALAAALIAVRTGTVVDMPLDDLGHALQVALDLHQTLRAVWDVRDGAVR
jgi:hypothetical protein